MATWFSLFCLGSLVTAMFEIQFCYCNIILCNFHVFTLLLIYVQAPQLDCYLFLFASLVCLWYNLLAQVSLCESSHTPHATCSKIPEAHMLSVLPMQYCRIASFRVFLQKSSTKRFFRYTRCYEACCCLHCCKAYRFSCVKCVRMKAIVMAGKDRSEIKNEVTVKSINYTLMFGIAMLNNGLLNLRKCS